jgi:hypothetical protein
MDPHDCDPPAPALAAPRDVAGAARAARQRALLRVELDDQALVGPVHCVEGQPGGVHREEAPADLQRREVCGQQDDALAPVEGRPLFFSP